MNILVVDNYMTMLEETVRSITEIWPSAVVDAYSDPFLCLKHGIGHPADLLVTRLQMRNASGQDLVNVLRRYHPGLCVVFMTDTPLRRKLDFEIPADSEIHRLVTEEALKTLIEKLARKEKG